MSQAKEFRELSVADLGKKLAELRMELIKLNSQVATGTPPKNPGQLHAYKKTIARIMTVMHQKVSTNE